MVLTYPLNTLIPASWPEVAQVSVVVGSKLQAWYFNKLVTQIWVRTLDTISVI